jgi:hypothetical protein
MVSFLKLSILNKPPTEIDPNDDVEVLLNGPVSTNNDDDQDYGDFGGGFGFGDGGFGFGSGLDGFFGSGFGRPRIRVLLVPVDSDEGPGAGGLGGFLGGLFGSGWVGRPLESHL